MSDVDDADSDGLELARRIADSYRRGRPAPRRRTKKPRPPGEAGPRAGRQDPQALANFLGELVAEHGWQANLSAQQVFTDWVSVVGDEVAQHSKVTGYADGQVEIEADSTAWATQLRLLAPRIVAKLNSELGQGSVVRINVRGPQGPSWIKGKRTIRNARGPRDTYG